MSTPRVIICCGSGGVGKTTTSAALAIHLAREGRRVAVLTIDPAMRLADALGIGSLGNTAKRVPLEGPGTLDAMMLDAKGTFDEVVGRWASTAEARDRILRNHYYRYTSERLAGVHEYMAMERLLQLSTSGAYDVVVLDTPPARHAIDFLAAPDKMARLMDEGVMRWLTLPSSSGGWRMIERGSEVLAKVLQSMLGEETINDIAEFFSAFQTLWDGFRERSVRVQGLLRDPGTTFLLVSTPSPSARADALDFLEILKKGKMPFAGFLVNRCVPDLSVVPGTFPACPADVDPDAYVQLCAELRALPKLRAQLLQAQEEAIRALIAGAPATAQVWRLPDLEDHGDTRSSELERLRVLARSLPGGEELGRGR